MGCQLGGAAAAQALSPLHPLKRRGSCSRPTTSRCRRTPEHGRGTGCSSSAGPRAGGRATANTPGGAAVRAAIRARRAELIRGRGVFLYAAAFHHPCAVAPSLRCSLRRSCESTRCCVVTQCALLLLLHTAGFDQKFSLTIFGKRLSSETARILLLGSGAIIVVLIVVISTMASTGPDAPAGATVGSPAPLRSGDPNFRPPPPPSPLVVRGCTQPRAQNYDPTATTNDGSCRYPPSSLPARPPPPPCVDDGNCDDLISVLGCTHELHGSNPQIPPGVVRILPVVHISHENPFLNECLNPWALLLCSL